MKRERLLLTILSLLIIIAGVFFIFYWDMREWHLTTCEKISCFIREIMSKWAIK